MKLRLKDFRIKLKKGQETSTLLCPWDIKDPKTKEIKDKGLAHWSKVGQVVEVPDQAGYAILQTHSDMLEIAESVTKRASAPANK